MRDSFLVRAGNGVLTDTSNTGHSTRLYFILLPNEFSSSFFLFLFYLLCSASLNLAVADNKSAKRENIFF